MRMRGMVSRSCLGGLLVVFLAGFVLAGVEAGTIHADVDAQAEYLSGGEEPAWELPSAPTVRHSLSIYPSSGGQGAVIIRPGVTICTSSCEKTFREGREVTLIAMPESGYVFNGWSGSISCPAERRCSFTMESDVSLGYSFVPGSPSLGVRPLSHAFDDQIVGETPQSVRLIISNARGTARLAISDMILDDAVNFSLVTDHGPGSCGSEFPVLDPRKSCTVEVLFDPKRGGDLETRLGITSNDPDTPLLHASFSGTGVSVNPVMVRIYLPAASSLDPPELGYRMVGIPVMPADRDTYSTLCPFFGGYTDPAVWRLFKLVLGQQVAILGPGQDFIKYGKGWWLISSTEKTIEITGMPHVGRWRRSVPAGYFLLACPYYDKTVRWADILNDPLNAPLRLGPDLFYWDGSGEYVSVDTLEPGKAYMAFAEQRGFLRVLPDYPPRLIQEPSPARIPEVIQPPPPPPPTAP